MFVSTQNNPAPFAVDIPSIKEAYTTLSSPDNRARYDRWLQSNRSKQAPAPRAAQVISLDDFQVEVRAAEPNDDEGPWHYTCRCGGVYTITSVQMERGHHLIGCTCCSEVVWVGYEVAEGN